MKLLRAAKLRTFFVQPCDTNMIREIFQPEMIHESFDPTFYRFFRGERISIFERLERSLRGELWT